jgi:hypothetical protein
VKQNWLLIKACRRAILKGFLLGGAAPLGFLLLLQLLLVAITVSSGSMGSAGDLVSTLVFGLLFDSIRWVYPHTFTMTLIAAVIAGLSHLMGGLSTALTKLPVPMSSRQQAYIPLGLVLVHWAALMAFYFLPLAIGTKSSGTGDLLAALSHAFWAFPLGLLFVALLNRPTSLHSLAVNSFSFLVPWLLFISLAVLTDLANMTSLNFQREIEFVKDMYPLLQPLFLLAAVLVLWETPHHRQNWHCASFTISESVELRESNAPQRLHPLSLCVRVLYYSLSCLVSAVLLYYSARMLLPLFDPGKTSFFFLAAGVLMLGSLAMYAVRYIQYLLAHRAFLDLHFLLTRTEHASVQQGRAVHGPDSTNPQLWGEPLVVRCPKTNLYRRSGRKEPEIESPQVQRVLARIYARESRSPGSPLAEAKLADLFSASLRPSQWLDPTSIVFFLLILTVSTSLSINGYRNREGSNIQGDIASRADEHYQARGAFSQHYVALDLSGTPRESALATIQAIVENSPDPTPWLAGLRTTEGEAAQVPEKYRIEVSQPEPNIVVVQSMGLHWDHAGHLAYALSKHIQDRLGDTLPLTVNPSFKYDRPDEGFSLSYGFLDNTTHWIQPEAESTDIQGDTSIRANLRNELPTEKGAGT